MNPPMQQPLAQCASPSEVFPMREHFTQLSGPVRPFEQRNFLHTAKMAHTNTTNWPYARTCFSSSIFTKLFSVLEAFTWEVFIP